MADLTLLGELNKREDLVVYAKDIKNPYFEYLAPGHILVATQRHILVAPRERNIKSEEDMNEFMKSLIGERTPLFLQDFRLPSTNGAMWLIRGYFICYEDAGNLSWDNPNLNKVFGNQPLPVKIKNFVEPLPIKSIADRLSKTIYSFNDSSRKAVDKHFIH